MTSDKVAPLDNAEFPYANANNTGDTLKGGSKKRKSKGVKKYKKIKSHKKTKHHKKVKGHKKTKKSPSTWIIFVKKWSASNNCSYRDALRNPKCKMAYHKSK